MDKDSGKSRGCEVSKRNQGIELLRIFSAVGIVWFHAQAVGAFFAYSGLVVFLILSFYLATVSTNSVQSDFWKRAKRLLLPWFFWFVFYGLLNVALRRPFFPPGTNILSGIFGGTSVHLWYMPFVFGCLVLLDLLRRHLSRNTLAYLSGFLAALIIFLAPWWRPISALLETPLPQYFHALAGVLMGIFFGKQENLGIYYRIVIFSLIFASLLSTLWVSGIGVPYLTASIAFLFFLKMGERLGHISIIDEIANCTLGVYFVHIFVLAVSRKINLVNGISEVLVVTFFSFLVIFGIRKIFPKYKRLIT